MNLERAEHAAVVLQDGTVLVVGYVQITETYDPVVGSWTPEGILPFGSFETHAVLLPGVTRTRMP